MWIWAVVFGILGAAGFILFGWLRVKTQSLTQANQDKEDKIDALETQARIEREEARQKDARDAKTAAGSPGLASDFLRDSWSGR